MPTVLRRASFRVVIFLPPREHAPPHVHVRNTDGETVIELAGYGRQQRVRSVGGMRTPDVVRAFRIVEAHTPLLIAQWRKYHG